MINGEYLKAIRKERGITLAVLSRETGGKRYPSSASIVIPLEISPANSALSAFTSIFSASSNDIYFD